MLAQLGLAGHSERVAFRIDLRTDDTTLPPVAMPRRYTAMINTDNGELTLKPRKETVTD
jgi:hypothetical protein